MGRTGQFLASEALGVSPDYIMLSKALGGGLAKISATLIRRDRHIDKFDVLHTSTYAEDDYSSAIALKTLELLDEAALAECRRKAGRLLRGLRQLMAAYPDIIVDVRGRGLMIGVEFRRMLDNPKFMLRLLTTQDDLVFVLVGYLFNMHRIRVAPTLSDPQTIRLEPSLLIDDREIDRFVAALEDVCDKLRRHDVIGLTRYFIEGPDRQTDTHAGRLGREVCHLRGAFVLEARARSAANQGGLALSPDERRRPDITRGRCRGSHRRRTRAVSAPFRAALESDRHELGGRPFRHGCDAYASTRSSCRIHHGR